MVSVVIVLAVPVATAAELEVLGTFTLALHLPLNDLLDVRQSARDHS